MSGSPSQAEVHAQLQNAVDVLETTRAHADGSVANDGGTLDTLEQALEGNYTPAGLTAAAARFRAGLSALASPTMARQFLQPILYEYGRLVDDGGYTNLTQLARAIYEHFHANSLSVETRAITFDTTATTSGRGGSGAIIGNGNIERLTVDEYGYPIEACHVETKRWRCRADQNSGTREHAESFELLGEASNFDNLLRANFGSGVQSNRRVSMKHAGRGSGGSLLRNSSFTSYVSTATPKFAGWTEVSGGSNLAQEVGASNIYRTSPGAAAEGLTGEDGSLRANGDFLIRQPLAAMSGATLDPGRPYQFRVMVNPTPGSATGGNIIVRMGSQEVSTSVAGLSSGWNELTFPLDENLWFRNFTEDDFAVEIEWENYSSGYMLLDDAIFDTLFQADGTWWWPVGGTTPHEVDDVFEFTDTGGAPATGKIQWWWWLAGFGYLPSDASPTLADPS